VHNSTVVLLVVTLYCTLLSSVCVCVYMKPTYIHTYIHVFVLCGVALSVLSCVALTSASNVPVTVSSGGYMHVI
jgi:hypothetical protein